MTSLRPYQKAVILLSLDGTISWLCVLLAELMTEGGSGWKFPVLAVFSVLLISVFLGLHRMQLLAYARHGIVETFIVAAGLGTALTLASALPGPRLPPATILMAALLFLALSFAGKMLLLRVAVVLYRLANARKRVLIYGAGRTGQQIAAMMAADERLIPVAFVDDNPRLQGLIVAGLQVHSPHRLTDSVQRMAIDMLVFSSPDTDTPKLATRLSGLGCETLSLAAFAEFLTGVRSPGKFALDDLLGRVGLERDLPDGSAIYRDKRILITGAGGSIGSEICRQLSCQGVTALVLLDHSELALYTIARELSQIAPDLPAIAVLGSVGNAGLVEEVLRENHIDIILHAAAYKHVPLVQSNLLEGLRNNVLGTATVADCAARAGVERFILISTDKAVRPSSHMGASKRLAEEIVQGHAATGSPTLFSMVRFGNVMGSSGSVIPLFNEQIASGGPVTVTHPEVTRYFMTIPEAVRLVLLAGSFAEGGDVFVLDMGEPVSILQIARQMIDAAGLTLRDDEHPDGDIEICFTGLREGEKLHEELLIGNDMLPTPHARILRAQEARLKPPELASALTEIERVISVRDHAAARRALHRWVTRIQLASVETGMPQRSSVPGKAQHTHPVLPRKFL